MADRHEQNHFELETRRVSYLPDSTPSCDPCLRLQLVYGDLGLSPDDPERSYDIDEDTRKRLLRIATLSPDIEAFGIAFKECGLCPFTMIGRVPLAKILETVPPGECESFDSLYRPGIQQAEE